jgi:hypothetical protein
MIASPCSPSCLLRSRRHGAGAAAALLVIGGCASTGTNLDTQWSDPALANVSLRSAKVLVSCDAYDLALRRICEEQMAAELTARGASPTIAADVDGALTGQNVSDEQRVQAARAASAKAAFAVRVRQAETRVGGGSGVSIGIGGFGIGGGSTRGGVGVGVSVPVGGQASTGHAANGTLLDSSSGRALWTATASTQPSSDYAGQMGELAKTLLGAAEKSGAFGGGAAVGTSAPTRGAKDSRSAY